MYRDSVTLAIHSFRYDNVQRTVLLPLQGKQIVPRVAVNGLLLLNGLMRRRSR